MLPPSPPPVGAEPRTKLCGQALLSSCGTQTPSRQCDDDALLVCVVPPQHTHTIFACHPTLPCTGPSSPSCSSVAPPSPSPCPHSPSSLPRARAGAWPHLSQKTCTNTRTEHTPAHTPLVHTFAHPRTRTSTCPHVCVPLTPHPIETPPTTTERYRAEPTTCERAAVQPSRPPHASCTVLSSAWRCRHYFSAHFVVFTMLVLGTISLALPSPPSERFACEARVRWQCPWQLPLTLPARAHKVFASTDPRVFLCLRPPMSHTPGAHGGQPLLITWERALLFLLL
jgi:hypothetical protein